MEPVPEPVLEREMAPVRVLEWVPVPVGRRLPLEIKVLELSLRL